MLYGMPERRIEPFERWRRAVLCPVCGEPDPNELRFESPVRYAYATDFIVGCEKCMPDIPDDSIYILDDLDEIYSLLGGDDYD